MIPFLYTSLTGVMRDLLELVVKESVLEKATAVCDIDITKESNLIEPKDIKLASLGHAVLEKVREIKLSKTEMLKFKSDCRSFVIQMCSLLFAKSPLKYSIVKYVTFCVPSLIHSELKVAKTRLTIALRVFSDKNWVSSSECDKIEKEFKSLTAEKDVLKLCKSYDSKKERVDHFWRDLLQTREKSQNLYNFIKKSLITQSWASFCGAGIFH